MSGELIEAARARVSAAAQGQGDLAALQGQVDDLLRAIGQVKPIVIEGGRETMFFGPAACATLQDALARLAGEDVRASP